MAIENTSKKRIKKDLIFLVISIAIIIILKLWLHSLPIDVIEQLNEHNADIILFMVLFGFASILFIVAITTDSNNKKSLFKLVVIFLIVHLVIFPFAYVLIINNDPKDIAIENTIEKNERVNALTDLNNFYNAKIIHSEIITVQTLLATKNNSLDSSTSYLNRGNILIFDTFMLYKNNITKMYNRPYHIPQLVVCNINGKIISAITKEIRNEDLPLETINKFLAKHKKEITDKYKRYNSKKNEVLRNKRIWTYSKILPYSLNIFSGNIKPIGRLANIIHSLHIILVTIILLSMITSSLLDIYNKK